MTSLLSRLQSATSPSRELDVAVCPYPTKRSEYTGHDWLYEVPGHQGRAWNHVPRYTESIDAVLTLYKIKPLRVPTNPIEACIEAISQWT